MNRNKVNKHHTSYDKATEYALRAIYEGCTLRVDGQVFSYDKDSNELRVHDFYGDSIYRPKFTGILCDPFKELVRREVNND